MTCQECELALGMDQDAAEHLSSCAACRALARELRENAAAFEAMADDPLLPVRYAVLSKLRFRQAVRWGWAFATAAALVVAFVVNLNWRDEKMPPVQLAHAALPRIEFQAPAQNGAAGRSRRGVSYRAGTARLRGTAARHPAGEPLMMKMLTPDPDVVIYWQVESEDK